MGWFIDGDNNMGTSFIRHMRRQLQSEHYEWIIKSSSSFTTTVIERCSGAEGERFTLDYSMV